jgi:NADH:ubiquinone oxidoreductase subunit 2 (subunit N)
LIVHRSSLFLLLLLPFGVAAGCFILRRRIRLVALAGAAAALVELVLLLEMPIQAPVQFLWAPLSLSVVGQFIVAALLVVVLGSLIIWSALPEGKNAVPATLLLLGLVIGACLIQSPFGAALLLFAAGLCGVMMLLDRAPGRDDALPTSMVAAGFKYLLVISSGAALLLAGLGLAQASSQYYPLAAGLVLAGLGLWLGLTPFHIALPEVAEESSIAVFAVVVGVIELGTLLLFVGMLEVQARVLASDGRLHRLLLGFAGLSIVVAPLLAYGTARRAVACLLTAGFAQLVFGLALGSTTGARSALGGLLPYALAVTLVAMGASMLEAPGVGGRQSAPALRARVIASTSLIAGLLVIVGVPPFAGWTARGLLWQAAREYGAWMLAVVVAGQLALTVATVRLVRIALLRAPVDPTSALPAPHASDEDLDPAPASVPPYAPSALRGIALITILMVLALGLYPAPLALHVEQVVNSLSFIHSVVSPP